MKTSTKHFGLAVWP